MAQTKGQVRALDILARIEAGESRADIARSYSVSESSIYFETRFGKFLRYRNAHPDNRADIGAWGSFDKLWGRTDKQAPEPARFAELICALPLATDAPAAKPPRKNAKAKTPAPTPEPEAVHVDPIATKRAAKTLAQRLRRAAAKAAVQWRGDEALTAAAE